ncbi:hypothetical protein [Dehalobacterium formicoaceticum]|uniref:hypothetical protein n=1 Tax=Dehalobacterium formicoaceticum TaxID=51515 RepID=UPI0031F71B12
MEVEFIPLGEALYRVTAEDLFLAHELPVYRASRLDGIAVRSQVYVVTSAEMMALFAADNIAQAIRNFGSRGYAKLSGLIHNSRNIDNEDQIVAQAADEMGTKIIGKLHRSKDVEYADQQFKTVCEIYPDSPIIKEYESLARAMLAQK